ncbi:MAG: EthD domain-containing protein [Actinomycetota bacterium]
MYKLTFCLRRRPDLTREEFQTYWRETHAALVADRAGPLRIRRYVQVHTEDVPGLHAAMQRRNGGSPEPFDGIAEIWVDSIDDLAADEPALRVAGAELLTDERNFIDLPNSPMFVTREHVIVDR